MQGDRQPQPKRTKHLEIAGGARIDQRIHDDPETLDFWQDEPAGMIYVNYVPEEEVEQIIAAGERDLTAGGEGFMQHLAVGNP